MNTRQNINNTYSEQIDIIDSILDLKPVFSSKKDNKLYNNSILYNKTSVQKHNPYIQEIEQDTINNNLMLRLNSELDIKKGNNKKKKNIILKPFIDDKSSLYENMFTNQINDFRGF